MSDSEVKEDFLHVDDVINGQRFCCLSFISPENVLKNKDLFIMTEFLKQAWGIHRNRLIDDICKKYDLNINEFKEKTNGIDTDINYEKLLEDFNDFKYAHNNELNDKFNEENNFQTSIRGVKVRGVYDSHQEAAIRAKVLSKKDRNHNVFIGQVGYWLPWDPVLAEQDKIEAEYQEEGLNELMKKYNENVDAKNLHYEEEKNNKIAQSKKDNLEKSLNQEDPWLNKVNNENNENNEINENNQ